MFQFHCNLLKLSLVFPCLFSSHSTASHSTWEQSVLTPSSHMRYSFFSNIPSPPSPFHNHILPPSSISLYFSHYLSEAGMNPHQIIRHQNFSMSFSCPPLENQPAPTDREVHDVQALGGPSSCFYSWKGLEQLDQFPSIPVVTSLCSSFHETSRADHHRLTFLYPRQRWIPGVPLSDLWMQTIWQSLHYSSPSLTFWVINHRL